MSLEAQIYRQIGECTSGLTNGEYAAFMRALSAWASEQADKAEYEPDIDDYEES